MEMTPEESHEYTERLSFLTEEDQDRFVKMARRYDIELPRVSRFSTIQYCIIGLGWDCSQKGIPEAIRISLSRWERLFESGFTDLGLFRNCPLGRSYEFYRAHMFPVNTPAAEKQKAQPGKVGDDPEIRTWKEIGRAAGYSERSMKRFHERKEISIEFRNGVAVCLQSEIERFKADSRKKH